MHVEAHPTIASICGTGLFAAVRLNLLVSALRRLGYSKDQMTAHASKAWRQHG
jgi:hypothetical protein